ncbi:MAG: protein phosphatase 2C domain-containing protein [Polyangiaceae bacterium]
MTLKHVGLGLTDVGCKRDHNEDFHLSDDALGLYIVADGMGGHSAGEIASSLAANTVQRVLEANKHVLIDLRDDPSHQNKLAGEKLLERAIQQASAEVNAAAREDRSKRGMGTTLDCVVVAGNRALVGHVGDSRTFLIRHGKVHRLTEDHTMTAVALKAGLMSKEEAVAAEQSNSLTRAVGTHPSVQVDTLLVECQPGDCFLLVTDGFYSYMSEGEVNGLFPQLATGAPLQSLIELAKSRGGRDNITALLVSITGDMARTVKLAPVDTRMMALQQIPLFAHLSYKERSAVLAVSSQRTFPADHPIVLEGAEGDDMYVIVSGRVVVEKEKQRIGELGPGGHFGEMVLVDRAPRSATVRTLEPSDVMVINRNDMMTLMRKETMISVKLLWSFVQTMSERLRTASTGMVAARQELVEQKSEPPSGPEAPFNSTTEG